MLVLHDPATLAHETVELLGAQLRTALESPERIRALVEGVKKSHHELEIIEWKASDLNHDSESLLRLIQETHSPDYIEHISKVHARWVEADILQENESVLPECFPFSLFRNGYLVPNRPPRDIFAQAGYYAFDMSSGITKDTWTSTLASANLAHEATARLFTSSSNPSDSLPKLKTVMALCRPPGHHCDGHRAGGYCYLNNAAVAISTYRHFSPSGPESHIAVLDLDFHHGNGTQEIFFSDPKVYYTSIHGQDEFPYYTGSADEIGSGLGTGKNLNHPLPTGSSAQKYLEGVDILLKAIEKHDPDFLVVSLGFDTFRLDPLGKFELDTDDYRVVAKRVRQTLNNVPAVILLEGGYVIEHLAANLLAFLEGWEEGSK